MRQLHERGSNFITFDFGSKQKQSNKLKNILSYCKYTINSLIYKRKTKVKGIYIQYYWRRRNKNTGKYDSHFYGGSATLFTPPPAITYRNLKYQLVDDIESILQHYKTIGSDTIELHKIQLHFKYN